VRRGMSWPARLPYMPLEVMSMLHLLTCISTRTGRCCFTLFYSCFTPALLCFTPASLLLYSVLLLLHSCFTLFYSFFTPAVLCFTPALLLLYSVLLLLHSYFTPALYITEMSLCFIYTRALLLLYSYFVTAAIRFLLKCMHVYTRALLLLDSIVVRALQSKACKRHLALVSKGLHALKHFIVELKHIIMLTRSTFLKPDFKPHF
jgi:hypothetical protein